jgi:hypothetical protein
MWDPFPEEKTQPLARQQLPRTRTKTARAKFLFPLSSRTKEGPFPARRAASEQQTNLLSLQRM